MDSGNKFVLSTSYSAVLDADRHWKLPRRMQKARKARTRSARSVYGRFGFYIDHFLLPTREDIMTLREIAFIVVWTA